MADTPLDVNQSNDIILRLIGLPGDTPNRDKVQEEFVRGARIDGKPVSPDHQRAMLDEARKTEKISINNIKNPETRELMRRAIVDRRINIGSKDVSPETKAIMDKLGVDKVMRVIQIQTPSFRLTNIINSEDKVPSIFSRQHSADVEARQERIQKLRQEVGRRQAVEGASRKGAGLVVLKGGKGIVALAITIGGTILFSSAKAFAGTAGGIKVRAQAAGSEIEAQVSQLTTIDGMFDRAVETVVGFIPYIGTAASIKGGYEERERLKGDKSLSGEERKFYGERNEGVTLASLIPVAGGFLGPLTDSLWPKTPIEDQRGKAFRDAVLADRGSLK